MVKTVVGDADSLMALLLDYDVNHKLATSLLKKLNEKGVTIIYPNTTISEAITSFLRRHSNPKLAGYLAKEYQDGNFNVEYVNEKIMLKAVEIFNPNGSKQNTFFDAIVAATAKSLSAEAIFSFDGWYQKLGFKLVSEIF